MKWLSDKAMAREDEKANLEFQKRKEEFLVDNFNLFKPKPKKVIPRPEKEREKYLHDLNRHHDFRLKHKNTYG